MKFCVTLLASVLGLVCAGRDPTPNDHLPDHVFDSPRYRSAHGIWDLIAGDEVEYGDEVIHSEPVTYNWIRPGVLHPSSHAPAASPSKARTERPLSLKVIPLHPEIVPNNETRKNFGHESDTSLAPSILVSSEEERNSPASSSRSSSSTSHFSLGSIIFKSLSVIVKTHFAVPIINILPIK